MDVFGTFKENIVHKAVSKLRSNKTNFMRIFKYFDVEHDNLPFCDIISLIIVLNNIINCVKQEIKCLWGTTLSFFMFLS